MKSLAIALLVGCASHPPEPPSAHVAPPTRSSIHGTIRSVAHEPLAGVTLIINPSDRFPAGRRPMDFTQSDFAQLVSDEAGGFAIPEVPPGRYEVLIYYADLSVRRVVDVRGPTAIDQTIDDARGSTGVMLECTGERAESCR